jgi:UPF0271 protein
MRVVLDTSAFIYLNDFRSFDEILTVQEVVDEVKDKVSSMKLSSMKIKIVEPAKKVVDEIKSTAKKTGDLEKLSETDVKVLAAARENSCTIISDDRNIQNVAEKLSIVYMSVFNKKISRLIEWKKFCKACKKFYDDGEQCNVCGSKLTRVAKKSIDVE